MLRLQGALRALSRLPAVAAAPRAPHTLTLPSHFTPATAAAVTETRPVSLSAYSTTTHKTSEPTGEATSHREGEEGGGSGGGGEGRRRARLLTLATASATAALGSLFLLYNQSSVKADGGGVVTAKVCLILILNNSSLFNDCSLIPISNNAYS